MMKKVKKIKSLVNWNFGWLGHKNDNFLQCVTFQLLHVSCVAPVQAAGLPVVGVGVGVGKRERPVALSSPSSFLFLPPTTSSGNPTSWIFADFEKVADLNRLSPKNLPTPPWKLKLWWIFRISLARPLNPFLPLLRICVPCDMAKNCLKNPMSLPCWRVL